MDFYTQKTYFLSDIQRLIDNEVEENIHLDYKRAEALSKETKKKEEITKDISAFANSDGGVIIYGVEEKDHKPVKITPIDGTIFTKEWLEQICNNIQQHIHGIEIIPIRIDGEVIKSIYIVKIPRSNHTPHMATDHKYYKRYNFQSIAMEEYEVRDLFYRSEKPELELDSFFSQYVVKNTSTDPDDYYKYDLRIGIVNISRSICKLYKLSIYIKISEEWCDFILTTKTDNINSVSDTVLANKTAKFSYTGKEPIFPDEALDICLSLKIPYYDISQFLEACNIRFAIWCEGGVKYYNYDTKTKELVEDKPE